MPQGRKAEPSLMRQLINHVSRHMNALQAIPLNMPIQDLILNHLQFETSDHETQRELELITATSTDIPTTAELLTLLKSRCRAIERIQITYSLKIDPALHGHHTQMEASSVNLHIPT